MHKCILPLCVCVSNFTHLRNPHTLYREAATQADHDCKASTRKTTLTVSGVLHILTETIKLRAERVEDGNQGLPTQPGHKWLPNGLLMGLWALVCLLSACGIKGRRTWHNQVEGRSLAWRLQLLQGPLSPQAWLSLSVKWGHGICLLKLLQNGPGSYHNAWHRLLS